MSKGASTISCPECGYALTGLTAQADGARVCPECSARWTPELERSIVKWAGWLGYGKSVLIVQGVVWAVILGMMTLGTFADNLRWLRGWAWALVLGALITSLCGNVLAWDYVVKTPPTRRPRGDVLFLAGLAVSAALSIAGFTAMIVLSKR